MLCILFSYSYPVIRAVKGLQGKEILLQIKDIAAVIFMSLARLKLSLWYRIKNAIRIKNPYPWHLARVQTPHPPPPHPLSMNQRRNFYWGEGVCTQAVDTQPPPPPHHLEKMLMNSRLQWCIYGYSFSMPGWKETKKKKVFYLWKQHNVEFTNINVIEAKLSEERSRWKLEIILFSVDWAEVTIACSSTWHIEVKHTCEN